MFGFRRPPCPSPAKRLPGRASPIRTADTHFVNHHVR
jgi:hypothetical protein